MQPNLKFGDPLAQLVEHNTFNVGVLGSSPKRITKGEVTRASPFFMTMKWTTIHIDETDSTNRWLREYLPLSSPTVVCTDYQTAGRGQGTNTWESERGKNLTFSIAFCPKGIKTSEQFVLSMAISVALTKTLSGLKEVSIKWPNDIYVGNKKICGILIENTLTGNHIKDCIMGIGLNVNQTQFVSNAPNPTSMALESGLQWNREEVLQTLLSNFGQLLDNWNEEAVRSAYRQQLYWRESVHTFHDQNGKFEATIIRVENDGHLLLCDTEGRERRYAFKEVAFLVDNMKNNS